MYQSYVEDYDYFFSSENKFCGVNLRQGSVRLIKEFSYAIQDFDVEQFNSQVVFCFRGQQGLQLW